MVLIPSFYAPTRIISQGELLTNLEAVIDGRRWSLVTSARWSDENLPVKLAERLGKPTDVIGNVPSNPTEIFVANLPAIETGEVVVAVGGGSVMDAAKAVVAIDALGARKHLLTEHLRTGAALPSDIEVMPLICVPTTSGTGSEVTPWATIWGEDKVKYSLTNTKLYPEYAVLAPELCVSMDDETTLSSGLDAVSHSMEAVWNRNHTLLSDQMACAALRILFKNLGECLKDANNLESRAQVQFAATMAGLAMATTQTALSHSISYPFTSLYGMPHGLACSFTLGAVCRFNMETDAERLRPISDGLGVVAVNELPDQIDAWFCELGLGRHVEKYVGLKDVDRLDENLITRARARNNIRDVDGSTARELARQGLLACILD